MIFLRFKLDFKCLFKLYNFLKSLCKLEGLDENLRERVEHAEDHPDVDHLGVRGGRQGAGETDKAVR